MPDLVAKLRRLWPCSARDRIHAIDAALAVCSSAETASFVDQLLAVASARQGAAAMDVLCRHWPRLGPAARGAARAIAADQWSRTLRSMLVGSDPARRSQALAVIATLPVPALAADVADLLTLGDPGAVAEAERAFATLAESALPDPVGRPMVLRALCTAAAEFDRHRCDGLLALIPRLLAAAGTNGSSAVAAGLRPWLDREEDPSHMVLRGLIRRAAGAELRIAAWVLLARSSQQGACLDRLVAPGPIEDHAAVWSRSHLLANPNRARRLRLIERLGHAARRAPVVVTSGDPAALPVAQRIGAIKWIAATALTHQEQERLLSPWIADPSPLVRHALVRVALQLRQAPSFLHDLCFDADQRVARSAAIALATSARFSSQALPLTLRRSPHPFLRETADQCRANRPESVTARDLRRFVQFGAPAASDVATRLNAAAGSVRRAATIAPTDDSIYLDLADQHAASDDAAARAAAARVLILAGGGGGGPQRDRGRRVLVALLEDPRADHRLAGLLLAERMVPHLGPAADLVDHVAAICRSTLDEAERTCAERVARRLLGEIRLGWERRAQAVEQSPQLTGAAA